MESSFIVIRFKSMVWCGVGGLVISGQHRLGEGDRMDVWLRHRRHSIWNEDPQQGLEVSVLQPRPDCLQGDLK